MKEIECVICGQQKESSLEHIIPKAMGNTSLTIDLVCEACNSEMGRKIDGPFVNNYLVDLKRNVLNLRGYKGNIPNPFKEGINYDGNKVRLDENFIPSLIPNLTENKKGFSLLARSKEEALEMGLKKLNRIRASDIDVSNFLNNLDDTEIEYLQLKINYQHKVNFKDIELGLLKIAYEYMYVFVGRDYYYDKISKKLRDILNNVINDKEVDFDSLILQNPKNVKENLKYMDPIHLITPTINRNKQLFLSIFLFNGFLSSSVLVSEDPQNYLGIDRTPRIIEIEKGKN